MLSCLFAVWVLLSACASVADGHLGLSTKDDQYINGVGQFFRYNGLGSMQYAVATLNYGGDSYSNRLFPCDLQPGTTYVDKLKMFTMQNPVKWQNYWARVRQKNPAVHAEDQILRVLPAVMGDFGDTVRQIHLFTRLSPCMGCTDKLTAFAARYPRVTFYIGYYYVYDNPKDPKSGQVGLNYAKAKFGAMSNVYFDQIKDQGYGTPLNCKEKTSCS